MDIADRIRGSSQVISIFGYWPTFHDAEVLWLRLDRKPETAEYGPTLDLLLHAFEMTSEVHPSGFYVLKNHVLIHFRFHGVVELSLESFNHQNAIFGLYIEDLRDRQWDYIHYSITIEPANGIDAHFQCHAIEVLGVTPCDADGNPIETQPFNTPG